MDFKTFLNSLVKIESYKYKQDDDKENIRLLLENNLILLYNSIYKSDKQDNEFSNIKNPSQVMYNKELVFEKGSVEFLYITVLIFFNLPNILSLGTFSY